MFSTVARFPSPGARAPSPPHRVGRGVRARGRRPAHLAHARGQRSRGRAAPRAGASRPTLAHARGQRSASSSGPPRVRAGSGRAGAGSPPSTALPRARGQRVRLPSRSAAADIVTARGGTLASHRARKRRQRTPRAPAGGDRPPDKGVRRAHVGHVQPKNDAVGRDASPLAMPRAFAAGGQAGRRRSQCHGPAIHAPGAAGVTARRSATAAVARAGAMRRRRPRQTARGPAAARCRSQ